MVRGSLSLTKRHLLQERSQTSMSSSRRSPIVNPAACPDYPVGALSGASFSSGVMTRKPCEQTNRAESLQLPLPVSTTFTLPGYRLLKTPERWRLFSVSTK